jgi:hypothetical protein
MSLNYFGVQTNIKTMEAPVHAVGISLDGGHIACGLEDGRLIILKAKSLRPAMVTFMPDFLNPEKCALCLKF